MASREQHPAELRERAVAMVFELRAESGSTRGCELLTGDVKLKNAAGHHAKVIVTR